MVVNLDLALLLARRRTALAALSMEIPFVDHGKGVLVALLLVFVDLMQTVRVVKHYLNRCSSLGVSQPRSC